MESTIRSSSPELPSTIGRYVVKRRIGQGAMGLVLLADDPVLGREVAVKLLRADLPIAPETRASLMLRMKNEAKASARVRHPNLVTLHDMGEDAALGVYLVFEYVEGATLKERIAEGALAPREVAKIAREIGEGLTRAHEAGIVHRDIKPENVILSKTGSVLADFGIAKIPDSTLTHAGGLLGTPAYGAPETFRTRAFSPASDQFSLAATLYEALSGERAFPGDDAALVVALIHTAEPAKIAAAQKLHPSVDEVFARALKKDPAERHASCEAFAHALVEAVERNVEAPKPPPSIPRVVEAPEALASVAIPRFASDPPRERKLNQVVVGGVVVLATASLLIFAATRPTAPDPLERALASASAAAVGIASSMPPKIAPAIRPRPSHAFPRDEPPTPANASATSAASASPPAASASSPPGASATTVSPPPAASP